ncbi:MAG TPA: NAD(P)-dependent oxidoreductase, partial [Methylomirabilota bacterium]|nr:NAD(P)-dependent oxidoreductase [Methylomirabilota bacterium]
GVVGLGTMGATIATRLERAGALAAVYDVDGPRAEAFGARAARTAEELAHRAELLLLCLPAPGAVQAALERVTAGLPRGRVVVDLSTNPPGVSEAAAARCAAAGAGYLEAPMTGGVRAARSGTLRLVIGGEAATLAGVETSLRTFASALIHVGPVGTASRMKLVHNMVTLGTATVAMEALLLAQALGVDAARMFEVLETGTASSYVVAHTLKRTLLRGDLVEGFKLRLAAKDLGLIQGLVDAAGLTPLVFPRDRGLFEDAMQEPALRDVDYPIVCRVLARLMGVPAGGGLVPGLPSPAPAG